MTPTETKAQIDAQITNKTADNSITPALVGDNMKSIVDLTPLEYCAQLFQSGTDDPVAQEARINTISNGNSGDTDYKSVEFERVSTGLYKAILRYYTGTVNPQKLAFSFGDGVCRIQQIQTGNEFGNSFVKCTFNTNTPLGVLADGLLLGNNGGLLSIKIYP